MRVQYQHILGEAEGRLGLEQRDSQATLNLAGLRDDELLALVTRRSEPALGTIYDRYGALVYTIALRITGDRQTAEEVVQDVFQSVWQTAAGFQPGLGSCASWLVGITRHRAIDAIRSKRERARSREQTIEPDAFIDVDANPDLAAVQVDLREAMKEALGTLPTSQRQAVELAYYGGLTRVEIAERLGEPVGTVKTRLRLGLLKLRDLLRPFAE
jgi:RNA polymerase sigma-70 factor (ECF subfamily)